MAEAMTGSGYAQERLPVEGGDQTAVDQLVE
jgi:hypothetical protein